MSGVAFKTLSKISGPLIFVEGVDNMLGQRDLFGALDGKIREFREDDFEYSGEDKALNLLTSGVSYMRFQAQRDSGYRERISDYARFAGDVAEYLKNN